MIAMGLILHPGAYFRVPWNLLDFVIVVTSLASLAADVNIVALRSLRLLRVLRPLRLISYFKARPFHLLEMMMICSSSSVLSSYMSNVSLASLSGFRLPPEAALKTPCARFRNQCGTGMTPIALLP